jgi:phage gpG-like protein
MEVEFKSNKDAVLTEFQRKKKLALDLIGEAAEGFVKDQTPVDTGRLRNSIAHQTIDDTAYIGTNVEYTIWVELKDIEHKVGKAHFLRDGVTQNGKTYEQIAKQVMQE